MNNQELEHRLKELQQEYDLKQKEVMRQFCDDNNQYKVGDKFTDHIGTIIIEKIRYSYNISRIPICIYFGAELKKDGTLKKSNDKRNAWQSDDVKGLK